MEMNLTWGPDILSTVQVPSKCFIEHLLGAMPCPGSEIDEYDREGFKLDKMSRILKKDQER